MMLAAEGYSVYEGVLSESECDRIISDIGQGDEFRNKAGVRNLVRSRAVANVANDPRLLGLTQLIAGVPLTPFKGTLFNKTGKANWLVAWHQDTALPVERESTADGWGPYTKKASVTFAHAPSEVLSTILALRIHIDPSTTGNGPLRVIPGSHRKRISNDEEFRRIVDAGPQVELTVGRGGVIAMSPLLIHASSKCVSNEPRRVLHIEYARDLQVTHEVRLAVA